MSYCSTIAAPPSSNEQVWGNIDLQSRTLRNLFGSYPTGVAIVTTRAPDGRPVGLTISSFASLSLTPPLVLWSLVAQSSNLEVFRHCPHFAISTLTSAQEEIAKRFATSSIPDKFAGVAVHETPEGVPVIAGALTTLVCVHDHCRDVGDHLLLVGKIVRTTSAAGTPLVFHGGKFRALAQVA